jgi:hypothetical protein
MHSGFLPVSFGTHFITTADDPCALPLPRVAGRATLTLPCLASDGPTYPAREVLERYYPMSRFLLSAVAVGLVAGLAPGADPSPPPGTPVTPFHPLNVNGPAAGEKACPV